MKKVTYEDETTFNYGSKQFRRDCRKEMVHWIRGFSPDAFITLNFNCDMTHNRARKKLRNFLARLDRRLIGPAWMTRPEQRADLIAVPENVRTNYHFHALGTLPPKAYDMCQVTLTDWIRHAWKSVHPSGSIHFDFNRYDKHVLPDYITKQVTRPGGIESFILSREFWSQG